MFLADYHVHTKISPDSNAPMADMIRATKEKGITQMCFTDHCDIVPWGTNQASDDCFRVFPEVLADRSQLSPEDFKGIDVRFGLELGEAHFSPERAFKIIEDPELDFIIGSVHVLKEHGDFFLIKYESEEHCRKLTDLYLDDLIEVAELDFFDVMAHIGYPTRYMARAGYEIYPDYHHNGDKIEVLLKSLIQNGKGIEINCSGIRDGLQSFPRMEVLHRYHELGGEVITVGSDAHKPKDAAGFVAEGYEILRQIGFKYVTTFKKRKPEFVKI